MKFFSILSLGALILATGCSLFGASSSDNHAHLKKGLASRHKALSGGSAMTQLDLSKGELIARLKTIAVKDWPRYLVRLIGELENNKNYEHVQEALEKIALVCSVIHEKFSVDPHPLVDADTANKLDLIDCDAEGFSALVILLNKCVAQQDSDVSSTPPAQETAPNSAPSGLLSAIRSSKTLRASGERIPSASGVGQEESPPSSVSSVDAVNNASMFGSMFASIKSLVGQGKQKKAAVDTTRSVPREGTPAGSRGTSAPSKNEDDAMSQAKSQAPGTSKNTPPPPPPPPSSKRPGVKPATQEGPVDRSQLLASIQMGANLRPAGERKLPEKAPIDKKGKNVSPESLKDAIAKAIKEGASEHLHPAGDRKLSPRPPSEETPMEAITRELKERSAAKAAGTTPQVDRAANNVTSKGAPIPRKPAPDKNAPKPKAPPMKDRKAGPSSQPPGTTPPQTPADDHVSPTSSATATPHGIPGANTGSANRPNQPIRNQNGPQAPIPSAQNNQALKQKEGLQMGKVLALTAIVGIGAWAFKTYYWDPKYKPMGIAAPSA